MSIIFDRVEPYGFWRQRDPEPIEYTEEYERKQSTTEDMSWLRLGFFLGSTECCLKDKYRDYSNWRVCDVGCGNGTFKREASKVFGTVCGYDIVGDSISKEELYKTRWNAVFLTDVLEHFQDINDLFKINTDLIYLSFPECPEVSNWEELKAWRHFKPNEHLWMLNCKGVNRWLIDNKFTPLSPCSGYPEDVIRRNKDVEHNIATTVAVNNDCLHIINKFKELSR